MYASLMAVIGEPPSSCRVANATWHFHACGRKQVEVEGKPSGEELEVACEFISPSADMRQESANQRSPSPSFCFVPNPASTKRESTCFQFLYRRV